MQMRPIGATFLALGLLLVPLTKSAMGQPFNPGPNSDMTQSLGQFSIVVNPAFAPAFVGNPAYNAATNILTSPLLFDQNTTIDRSAVTQVGVPPPVGGFPVGLPADGTVTPAGLTYPPGYVPPAGEDTVYTKINTFDLSNGGGFDVKAGAAAPTQPASIGEVTSNATGANVGNPAADFPARSFFDIFVDVDVPGLGSPMVNTTPLIINNNAITSFPPVVIYTHGNSSAVQLDLTAGNAFGEPAGTVFGVITLAGHGAGYTNGTGTTSGKDENTGQDANATDFESTYMQDLNTPTDLMPLPNVQVTTPGFGTSNEESWSSYVPDVPEPSSLSLLAVGIVAAGLRNRGRRKASEMKMA